MDKKFNYILIDEQNKPTKIIYFRYKTAKTYDKFVINTIPQQLAKILQQYINDAGLLDMDVLFPARGGTYYKSFSRILSDTFKKYTRKKTTVNMLRHAKITDFLSTKKTPNQRKALAKLMAHNVSTQALYDRM